MHQSHVFSEYVSNVDEILGEMFLEELEPTEEDLHVRNNAQTLYFVLLKIESVFFLIFIVGKGILVHKKGTFYYLNLS